MQTNPRPATGAVALPVQPSRLTVSSTAVTTGRESTGWVAGIGKVTPVSAPPTLALAAAHTPRIVSPDLSAVSAERPAGPVRPVSPRGPAGRAPSLKSFGTSERFLTSLLATLL